MSSSVLLLELLLASLLMWPASARADVYTLGSSYTWDAYPSDLDGGVEWHIDCGKSLVYIYLNPSYPCVGSSTVWPVAFLGQSFAAISFQPVDDAGSTLSDDIITIYRWASDQPGAALVVIDHTWPVPPGWEKTLHQPGDPLVTNRSLAYGYQLMVWIQTIFPDREVRLTRSNEMLDRIWHDCATGACPLPHGFGDMFRDASGHMSDWGSYLQHNALRAAMGQPVGVSPPSVSLPPDVRDYLDDVVVEYMPEPGGNLLLASGLVLLAGLASRRR